MIKKMTHIALVAVTFMFGCAALVTPLAYAEDATGSSTSSGSSLTTKTQVQNGIKQVGGTATSDDLPKVIASIINILLFIAGAVAVIMIIVGGLRYITSNGDQTHVKAAKDTILYSVIGLVVALLAFAIVNFVVTKL